MISVAFDTLKLAQRLEAAGFPAKQAQDMASAMSDTIVDTVVTREYLDLRLGEIGATTATRPDPGKANDHFRMWLCGIFALDTVVILAGTAVLLRLLH